MEEINTKISLSKKKILFSKIKRKILRHTWLVRGFFLLGLVGLLLLVFVTILYLFRNSKIGIYTKTIKCFITGSTSILNPIDDRVNILVLGKKGEGDSPDITDTIIFSSFSLKDNSISLISIPRDLWIYDLKTKINSVYYYGNQKANGGGLVLAKSEVEEVLGYPVQYGMVVDYKAFRKIIEIINGITVEIDRSFTDNKFPVEGKENDNCGGDPELKCRYKTVSFEKGKKFMNSEEALTFVRSRSAEGEEGTDFARAKRQQKIFQAIKDKVFSKDVILSPQVVRELLLVSNEMIETDIGYEQRLLLARLFLKSRENILNVSIPDKYLKIENKNPKYDNLYIITTDFWQLKNWTEKCLEEGECQVN